MARAERYRQADQLESAEIEYLNALKADPRNAVALAGIGIISQTQGQWTKAMAFLQSAKAADTNNLAVRRSLALTYASTQQDSRARDEAEYVVVRRPTDEDAVYVLVDASQTPEAIASTRYRLRTLLQQSGEKALFHVGLAELSIRQRDFRIAEDHLAKARSLDPRSSMVNAAQANWHFAQNDRTNGARFLMAAAGLAAPRSFIRLKWADFLIQSGRVEDARLFLEELSRKAPGYMPALSRLCQIAFDQRKYAESSAELRKMLAAEPLGFQGLLLSAKLHLAQGRSKDAREELERMESLYPRSPVVHYQLAIARLASGDSGMGLASLGQAVRLDKSYSEAVLLLAEIQVRRGDVFSAINSISDLLKMRPQLLQAHLALAEAYRVRGTPDDAVSVYRQVIGMYPKDPQAPYLMGITFRQQKKLGEARQAFESALAVEPSYLRAVMQLVELDIESKNIAAALERAQRYATRFPNRAEPQWLLAQVHMVEPDRALAEQALRKAIELNPDFSAGYVALARLMAGSGRQKQATERLQQLLDRNPKDVSALLLLAMVHEQAGEILPARDAYDRLLVIDPRHGPALNNAAYLYAFRLGQVEKGLELARRARERSPSDPFIADTLGWILHVRGDYPAALAMLQESATQLPTEPEVLFHLGMTHYMMGEEVPARSFVERSLSARKGEFAGKDEAERIVALLKLDSAAVDSGVLAALEKRLADRPDDPIAVSRMAAIYARNGDADKAIKICEKALKANPDVVRLLVQLSELYSEQRHDPVRALHYARDARKLAPEDSQVAGRLGRVAFQSRDYKWAHSLLQDAARRRPDEGEILASAAWAAYSVGQLAEAELLMQRALQVRGGLASSNAASRFLTMCALFQEPSKIPSATAQLQEALAAHPDEVPVLMVVGLAHEQMKRLENARMAYERALALYPEFVPAMKHLSGIYVEQGIEERRALELASKARETFPHDLDLSRTLGILAYRRGDFAASVRLLGPVTVQRTNDAAAYYYLGMAHHRLKAMSESQRALRHALELDANSPFATEARKLLADSK